MKEHRRAGDEEEGKVGLKDHILGNNVHVFVQIVCARGIVHNE